jgi:hypothetical protein
MRKLILLPVIVLLFVCTTSPIYADPIVDINSHIYKYAKLVIIDYTTTDDKGKVTGTSTHIWLEDGSGKEISSWKDADLHSEKDTRNEAFKDFLEKYGKNISSNKVTELSVLNALGLDGWEVIHIDNTPFMIKNGTLPRIQYLLKKGLPIK